MFQGSGGVVLEKGISIQRWLFNLKIKGLLYDFPTQI